MVVDSESLAEFLVKMRVDVPHMSELRTMLSGSKARRIVTEFVRKCDANYCYVSAADKAEFEKLKKSGCHIFDPASMPEKRGEVVPEAAKNMTLEDLKQVKSHAVEVRDTEARSAKRSKEACSILEDRMKSCSTSIESLTKSLYSLEKMSENLLASLFESAFLDESTKSVLSKGAETGPCLPDQRLLASAYSNNRTEDILCTSRDPLAECMELLLTTIQARRCEEIKQILGCDVHSASLSPEFESLYRAYTTEMAVDEMIARLTGQQRLPLSDLASGSDSSGINILDGARQSREKWLQDKNEECEKSLQAEKEIASALDLLLVATSHQLEREQELAENAEQAAGMIRDVCLSTCELESKSSASSIEPQSLPYEPVGEPSLPTQVESAILQIADDLSDEKGRRQHGVSLDDFEELLHGPTPVETEVNNTIAQFQEKLHSLGQSESNPK